MKLASSTVDELVDDLGGADLHRRNQALAELVARGRAAVPALLAALQHADVEVRAHAVNGLATIADPACADTFAALLADPDERIRSRAAHGLARTQDPRALDALVRTVDDYPDLLRHPTSLSADGLIEVGPPALPRIGPLLSAPDPMTRARAYYILQNVVSAIPGEDWQARWRELGAFDPLSRDDEARERAAEAWRGWIAARAGAGS